MSMKTTLAIAAAVTTVVGLHTLAEAQLRPAPKPVLTVAPTFNCSVTVSGTTGKVFITKGNAVAVDKKTDVVATVNTSSGKVSVAVCGAQFSSNATGTQVSSPVTIPASTDKDWIYTCSAVQTPTTSACNPPK